MRKVLGPASDNLSMYNRDVWSPDPVRTETSGNASFESVETIDRVEPIAFEGQDPSLSNQSPDEAWRNLEHALTRLGYINRKSPLDTVPKPTNQKRGHSS